MPYLFKYKRKTDEGIFKCSIAKYQCEHMIFSVRCKRQQYIGFSLCYQHLASDAHVKIAFATNPEHGKGLFATNGTSNNDVVFKKDERIIQYNGEVLNKEELDERYGGDAKDTAPYGYHVNKDKFIDSACLRSAGSLANHKPLREANAKLYFYTGDKNVYIRATKEIRNNEEIFVNYGRYYKFLDNHETKYYYKRL